MKTLEYIFRFESSTDGDPMKSYYKDTYQQLVRCKDCKYGEKRPPFDDNYSIVCGGRYHKGDWFCADGVRK